MEDSRSADNGNKDTPIELDDAAETETGREVNVPEANAGPVDPETDRIKQLINMHKDIPLAVIRDFMHPHLGSIHAAVRHFAETGDTGDMSHVLEDAKHRGDALKEYDEQDAIRMGRTPGQRPLSYAERKEEKRQRKKKAKLPEKVRHSDSAQEAAGIQVSEGLSESPAPAEQTQAIKDESYGLLRLQASLGEQLGAVQQPAEQDHPAQDVDSDHGLDLEADMNAVFEELENADDFENQQNAPQQSQFDEPSQAGEHSAPAENEDADHPIYGSDNESVISEEE